jgi:hypothetical protein
VAASSARILRVTGPTWFQPLPRNNRFCTRVIRLGIPPSDHRAVVTAARRSRALVRVRGAPIRQTAAQRARIHQGARAGMSAPAAGEPKQEERPPPRPPQHQPSA